MRVRHAFSVAALLWCLGPTVGASAEASEAPPLAVTEVAVRPHVGRVLERLDVTIALAGGPFENPDDPTEIDVQAVFEAPGRKSVSVPAFWYQDHRVDEEAKQIVPQGEPGFRARYTPLKPGAYRCTVRATAGKRKAEAAPVTFQVLKAEEDARGFLRFHETNPTYYQEPRSGRTVFLMGCQLDVHQFGDKKVEKAYGTGGLCDLKEGVDASGLFATWDWCRQTIDALADAGATCVRLPLHSWYLPLEAQGEKTWIPGMAVGRYHGGNAWVADRIIDRCTERGLVVLPVIWNYYPVTLRGGVHPYAIYGEHKALVERRLRYQVARWSYSPAVLGWTLFDRAEFNPKQSDYWMQRITYLRGLDPNPHFVFNTPYGVDQEEYWYPRHYGYSLGEFYDGTQRPHVVSGYGVPEHVERLARSGLWAAVTGHRAGAIFLHAWHLREAGAVEAVYRPTAAILAGADLGAHTWRKAYFDTVTGPHAYRYGMVGDKERALAFFMRSSAHQDEPYTPLRGLVMRMGDFKPGQYAVAWWRPGRTEPFERTTVQCGDDTILLSMPEGLQWHWMATVMPAKE